MAQEVKDSTIATGSDMSELLTNVRAARQDGWITAGPVVSRAEHLAQSMIKLGPLRT